VILATARVASSVSAPKKKNQKSKIKLGTTDTKKKGGCERSKHTRVPNVDLGM